MNRNFLHGLALLIVIAFVLMLLAASYSNSGGSPLETGISADKTASAKPSWTGYSVLPFAGSPSVQVRDCGMERRTKRDKSD